MRGKGAHGPGCTCARIGGCDECRRSWRGLEEGRQTADTTTGSGTGAGWRARMGLCAPGWERKQRLLHHRPHCLCPANRSSILAALSTVIPRPNRWSGTSVRASSPHAARLASACSSPCLHPLRMLGQIHTSGGFGRGKPGARAVARAVQARGAGCSRRRRPPRCARSAALRHPELARPFPPSPAPLSCRCSRPRACCLARAQGRPVEGPAGACRVTEALTCRMP